MTLAARLEPFQRLWRYYQAGLVNTVFGYLLYSAFVRLGINMYVAQLMSHTIGSVFNYFTYSRYAFRGAKASKGRFAVAYIVNYLIGVALLAACHAFIPSPYLSAALAIVIATIINFFVLNRFVFLKIAPDSLP